MKKVKTYMFGTVFSILVILTSIYYRDTNQIIQKKLISVLNALEKLESKYTVAPKLKVAIGYGICTDVYIEAHQILDYLDIVESPEHFSKISNEEELVKSFAYYFKHGAAAERYMSNSTLFNYLVEKARSFPNSYSTIGGNAALMALRFIKEGCDVILAAKMTKPLLQMIPDSIKVVGEEIKRDDVHLILEYKKGQMWGPFSSPRANRFIIHNDLHNPTLSGFDELDKILPDFKPDLLIISGLQMMNNYPFTSKEKFENLKKVNVQIQKQTEKTKIHFEMASFSEESFVTQLNDLIIPYCDSLGMNEQEIVILKDALEHKNISFVSNSTPRVATILDYMRDIFKIIRHKTAASGNIRKLSRIHVHTLAYQAFLVEKNSSWKNTHAAAAKASLTAHRHVCSTNAINVDKATLIMDDSFTSSIFAGTRIPLNVDKPVSCWNENVFIDGQKISIDICVAPVLVCTEVAQTAGGGDNISSAGLVLQI